MAQSFRKLTIVVPDRLALQRTRLATARGGGHGTQVMTLPQLAARLAGGFIQPAADDALQAAVRTTLANEPLGDLEAIRHLPGAPTALTASLTKAWLAGVDLAGRSGASERIATLARLDVAAQAALPVGMLAPPALVRAAQARIRHARAIFGDLELAGCADVAPCWRPLVQDLAGVTRVTWRAGTRAVPAWVRAHAIAVVCSEAATPQVTSVSAADAVHESIEAMRWTRRLLAAGVAAADIAIAAASTMPYDEHLLALSAEAGIELHCVHGMPAMATREGQQAAALAEVLVNGLTNRSLRRLARVCGGAQGPFSQLPRGWLRVLPEGVALRSELSWQRALDIIEPDRWPDGVDHAAELRHIIGLLLTGLQAAGECGAQVLNGKALTLWQRALVAGPPAALLATLATLRMDDAHDPCTSVCWMPASALAGSPRKHVRLLGLNAGLWPRRSREDALLPGHILAPAELDPSPLPVQDRSDFAAIVAGTSVQLVLSHARRDSQGRHIARSPLLPADAAEQWLVPHAPTTHPLSEADRLFASQAEFRDEAQAVSAIACWRDWHNEAVTPHDGIIRAGHPALEHVAGRTQSASSLRKLLRYPLAYLWEYGLRLQVPDDGDEALVLDKRRFGLLVHAILEHALAVQQRGEGSTAADWVAAALPAVQSRWESREALPPLLVWRRTLGEAAGLAIRTMALVHPAAAGTRSYAEVPFGGRGAQEGTIVPWVSDSPVPLPGTGLVIGGSIDRLDISADGRHATVRDYKTGAPMREDIVLNGGAELQRSLYAFAAQSLLGNHVQVRASLLYLDEQVERVLEAPADVLATLAGYLRQARENLVAGGTLAGPDSAGDYDDFRLLLPALARQTYRNRKDAAIRQALGPATQVWEAQ